MWSSLWSSSEFCKSRQSIVDFQVDLLRWRLTVENFSNYFNQVFLAMREYLNEKEAGKRLSVESHLHATEVQREVRAVPQSRVIIKED